MSLTNIRVATTILATFTAILFIILSYLFPQHSVLILTIEVILLPTIYIIGNYYIEDLIRVKYEKIIEFISQQVNDLREKYINQLSLNNMLKKELRLIKNEKIK